MRQKLSLLPAGFYLSLCLVAVIAGFWLTSQSLTIGAAKITTYQQCTASPGSKLLLTFPSQCTTSSGQRFFEPTPSRPIPPQSTTSTQPSPTSQR